MKIKVVVFLAVVALAAAGLRFLASRPESITERSAAELGTTSGVAEALRPLSARAPAVATPPAAVPLAAPAVAREDAVAVPPDPVKEPSFAAFNEWLTRYAQADAAAKQALEGEGQALARTRLTAMADLIPADPSRALELALAPSAREGLPESIRALLEIPLNATGDFFVMGTLPFGGAREKLPAVFRTAKIEGEEYQAFTFGRGLNFITKQDVPLNGYSVPRSAATKPPVNPLSRAQKLLVLDPHPARVLGPSQVAAIKSRGADVLCSVSSQPWTERGTETAAEIGGKTFTFCGPAHLRLLEDQAIAASGLESPGGGAKGTSASGKSSYTEGRKRMLLMRPYWTNQPVAMTLSASTNHFLNFSNYMWQMSYGKLTFAPLGEGSDMTPDMLIPGDVDSYEAGLGSGAGQAWQAVRDVARTNYSYDLTQYDFLYYVTTDQPSADYCGLGFVGGVGFHLANSCFSASVSAHEFGHNLGLNHAHFWDTALQSIVGSGQNVEYGDSTDPMGGGGDPNQFGSRYKNYLSWITNSDIATIPATGSNFYRLYCFDLDYSVSGLRGLRFANTTPTSDYYWLQFRQRRTSAPALMNGAQLLWTDNGGGSSYLLDVRLKGSASDNAIVIGRTFSDTNLNFHVTPIGKGNTYPESLDIVAVTGPQPGNQPPFAVLAASTLNPSVGQAVNFTATASDPNGDALAYYWEFGDGADSYSFDNQPFQSHAFGSAGEYAVRCVVSDMRGGTAQHTLIVRVGNPSAFRISGHVMNERAQPMAGARVTAGSRSVFSDSDGSYTIPGLAADSYSVTAIEPVRGAFEFIHPHWNNPLTLGPSARNIDFIVGTGAPPVTLIQTGAIWRYLDDGSDQGVAWRAPAFSDVTWSNGPTQLGYGGDGENTVIRYGTSSTNKHITYYFRHAFNVANPASLTNFFLSVKRDDGIIVYLNGTEVYRDNMPAGAATYQTLAPGTASDDGDDWHSTNVPPALLMTGNNVFAAEVHQESRTSSDITFNLMFTAQMLTSTQRATIVYVESPADNAAFTSPTNVGITAYAVGTPNAVTNVDILDGATKIASIASPPYTTVLTNPANGTHVLRAMSIDSTGLRRTSAPVNITVSAPLPSAPPPVMLTYVQTNASWRYRVTNTVAPAGWPNVGFNDSTWSNGITRLGFNSGVPISTNINSEFYGGPSGARFTTAYFRRPFVVNDPSALTNLTVTFARDDGIVVYLNGLELFRDNMPAGTISYATFASGAADNGQTYFTYEYPVPPGALSVGTNVIAAEVHQSANNSSDMAFDLWLSGQASTNRARGCWLAAPADGSTINLPGGTPLAAQVVAGGNLGIARVEFYSDGALIGQDTTIPYSMVWTTPGGGAHVLTAVAFDTAGGSITSAPVNVTVPSVPTGDALISFGDVWKYRDDGTDAGTTWKNSAFNDNAWMMGPARLGYGGDGEITTVSYGTNANAKHVTTYFRRKFVVPSPATLSGLLVRLTRDDGAVVYINGLEVFRSNLQPGPVSYNSLAPTGVGGSEETTPLEVVLGATNLFAGTNTIAVEVHQDSVTSSDLGFDLALIGYRHTNTAHGVYLTSPAHNTHYNLPASVSLTANAASTNGAITLVEYFDGATKVGQGTAAPFAATWNAPSAGNHVLTAVATDSGGVQLTSPPISIVVGPAPPPIAPVFAQFINWGSQWRYWDSASAVGNGWPELAFDDTAWPLGNGRFGWGIDGEATELTPRITHYFRRAFVVTNGGALDSLTFNALRDDGLVVYLNGSEVFRTNMPVGPVDGSTLASATVNTPDETIPVTYTIPTAGFGLLYGTNVVAVELHQSSSSSSDGGFDLSLYGEGTSEARIYLGSPGNNSSHVTGTPIRLEANAQAAAGRVLTAIEFFSDGVKVGEATALPYRFNWSGASTGQHTIVARSLDNLGNSLTSAPVQISVGPQLVSLVLVPSGSIWKYLDNGTDQNTAWRQTNFNDNAWPSGPAELGYGDLPDGRPEATAICCSNAAVKNITYYFRHQFVVPPDTVFTNLTFNLVRDDGAVVYLNGAEMYRSNMPPAPTPITYATLAPSAVSGSAEATFFATTIATNLPAGTNLVAVEIHQSATDSSDVSFDLRLTGNGYVVASAPPVLSSARAGGQMRVAWPATATGYQLFCSPEVGPGAAWAPVAGSPVVTNGMNVVTIQTTNPAAFYRLQKP